jgi:hypothetical protein
MDLDIKFLTPWYGVLCIVRQGYTNLRAIWLNQLSLGKKKEHDQ